MSERDQNTDEVPEYPSMTIHVDLESFYRSTRTLNVPTDASLKDLLDALKKDIASVRRTLVFKLGDKDLAEMYLESDGKLGVWEAGLRHECKVLCTVGDEMKEEPGTERESMIVKLKYAGWEKLYESTRQRPE